MLNFSTKRTLWNRLQSAIDHICCSPSTTLPRIHEMIKWILFLSLALDTIRLNQHDTIVQARRREIKGICGGIASNLCESRDVLKMSIYVERRTRFERLWSAQGKFSIFLDHDFYSPMFDARQRRKLTFNSTLMKLIIIDSLLSLSSSSKLFRVFSRLSKTRWMFWYRRINPSLRWWNGRALLFLYYFLFFVVRNARITNELTRRF